jgi:protein-S-isoprenylcysteine O-methyltransferase Ste14
MLPIIRFVVSGPGLGARVFAFAGGALFVASLIYGVFSYAFAFDVPGAGTSAVTAGLIDVALFTVFAAHHSVFARSGVMARVQAMVPPRLERSVYVWLASALFIVVCAGWRPVSGEFWTVAAPFSLVMVAVQLTGLVMTLAASRRLDVLSLAGIRQVFGGNTTTPVGLLDTGLYGVVRHPIYFGWVLMVWPTPHMNGTRLIFAAISTVYLAAAIPFEERSLRRDLGSEYDRYITRVKWKMVPFVY